MSLYRFWKHPDSHIPKNDKPALSDFDRAVLVAAGHQLFDSLHRGAGLFDWEEMQRDYECIADRTGASPEALINAVNSGKTALHHIVRPPDYLIK